MKTFAPFARSAQVFFAAPNVEGFSRIASIARFAGPSFFGAGKSFAVDFVCVIY